MRMIGCLLILAAFGESYGQENADLKVLSEDSRTIVIEYTPHVTWDKVPAGGGEEHTRFQFENALTANATPGSEIVHYRAALLALPSTHYSLQVVAADYRELAGVRLDRSPHVTPDEPFSAASKLPLTSGSRVQGSPRPRQPARLVGVGESRGMMLGTLEFFPVQLNEGSTTAKVYSRIVVQIEHEAWPSPTSRSSVFLDRYLPTFEHLAMRTLAKTQAGDSPLAQGEWYRMDVKETGIYKLDRDFFTKANISMSSIGEINSIRIYGRNGQALPEDLNAEHPSAPKEIARLVVDKNGNGALDPEDFVLFYGQSPRWWKYDPSAKSYSHYLNYYTETNYYFLTFGGSARGKQMDSIPSLSVSSPFTPGDFQAKLTVEEEKFNEDLKSGRQWLGQSFNINDNSGVYTNLLPGVLATKPIQYRFLFYSRSTSIDSFQVLENDQRLGSVLTFPVDVSPSNFFTDYYYRAPVLSLSRTGSLPNDRSIVRINFFTRNQGAKGFLDWFEIFYRQKFEAVNDALLFDSPDTNATVEYALSKFSSRDLYIFNVTNHNDCKRITNLNFNPADASAFKFQATQAAGQIQTFAAVGPNGFKTPANVKKIPNSNLQGFATGVEFIIIAPPEFLNEAERLKSQREKQEGLKILVVNLEHIFDEFANGSPDPTAIRNFLSYAQTTWTVKPRYVLLFGDGNYDYKNISTTERNRIPPYETLKLGSQLETYTSDDYFVLLSTDNPRISMAIGRLTVGSEKEAAAMVDKIIGYETSSAVDPWRNRVTFVADDGLTSTSDDGSLHTGQAEALAQFFTPPRLDKRKIYIVEYPTISGATGRRKPEANKAIIDAMNRGSVVVNYTGHGNPQQWAHEFIFTKDESIPQLKNRDRLFFLVAATCDFARYDDPREQSAGELLLVMPDGGAIGTLTSSRVVYSDLNAGLNNTFYNYLFETDSLGRPPRLGDVMWLTKQIHFNERDDNDRKYHLLADPTMRLLVPRPLANVDSINGKVAAQTVRIPTLGRVTVKGEIRKTNGIRWSDFNGRALLEVFDSKRNVPVPEWGNFSFEVNGSLLYRGEATVSNGAFQAYFPVPKDVSYDTSSARIALYAWSSSIDAIGYTESVTIAGTDTTAPIDTVGPTIQAYIDNPSFRPGDVVAPDATLIVDLSDESGINTSAAGIGHRLQATFRESDKTIDLSDYYRSNLDTYKSGRVQYPLTNLAEGRHSVVIKAWDIHNNIAQTETYFDVRMASGLSLFNVVNVPNPFTQSTVFTFQRNFPDPIDVEIKIYTIAGRMIESIDVPAVTSKFVQIPWNGRDRDGNELANGVYFYKVIAKTQDRSSASEVLGKLSVLR